LAVVALKQQRITIYGANGKLMQAPVSTGRSGYETPAGVFSILEKRREHYSNLYDDAAMPFMQRLTWSGIALHAGALPGRPASHGCIRLPHSFAGQFFDQTRVGMRVLIVPSDVEPVEIVHPLLFKPGPIVSEPNVASIVRSPAPDDPMRLGAAPADAVSARTRTWRALAAERLTAAGAATKAWSEARSIAAKATSDAAAATRQLRVAEADVRSAERRLAAAQRSIDTARSERVSERAETDKAKAAERLAEARRKLETVAHAIQANFEAAQLARDAASAAEATKVAAQDAAKIAESRLAPVSVFISRKTQRLYVRQGFQPVFDAPVTIRDPEMPVDTTTFTALSLVNDAELRWSALALTGSGKVNTNRQAQATDEGAAKAVLDRISIAPDDLGRINEVASVGASLIVSDEAAHPRETGKGTDFIVVMTGEPQGGLTIRPKNTSRDDRERSYRGERERSYPRSRFAPSLLFSW
jgi:hypothetical protein